MTDLIVTLNGTFPLTPPLSGTGSVTFNESSGTFSTETAFEDTSESLQGTYTIAETTETPEPRAFWLSSLGFAVCLLLRKFWS